jgi:putative transposase
VVGIFPDRSSIIRLIGAVLMEQTDEWTEQRRYMGTEISTSVDQAIAAPPSAADPPSLELPDTAMA